jgi:hypothetical protein
LQRESGDSFFLVGSTSDYVPSTLGHNNLSTTVHSFFPLRFDDNHKLRLGDSKIATCSASSTRVSSSKYSISTYVFTSSKLCRFGKSTVLVQVGQRSEHKVDEKLLRNSSSFFKAALSHEWKESQARIIDLPTIEPETFQAYLDWLHTHRVYVSTSLDPSPDQRQQEMDKLIDAYILGDYLQDIDYIDTIMDAILDWAIDLPPQHAWLDMRRYIIQIDDSFSRLLKVLSLIAMFYQPLNLWKSMHAPDSIATQVDHLLKKREQEELSDNGDKAWSARSFELARVNNPCCYHCHGEKDCYKKKKK